MPLRHRPSKCQPWALSGCRRTTVRNSGSAAAKWPLRMNASAFSRAGASVVDLAAEAPRCAEGMRCTILRARPPRPKYFLLRAEQREDGLGRLIGDGQRLDAELLARLQGAELGRFGGEIGVD